MAAPAVKVEGAANLKRTLIAQGKTLEDLTRLHKAIEDRLIPIMVARAPRGPTGNLKASLRGSGTKDAAVSRAGGAKVRYGRPIHWGWPARHIAPNRFVWDVIAEQQRDIEDMYEDELDRVLEKVEGV